MKTNIEGKDGKIYRIDIEKAKELGLFEETSKPHNMKEFAKYYGEDMKCVGLGASYWDGGKSKYGFAYDVFSSEEEEKAFVAFGRLLQLRDAWTNNWKPSRGLTEKEPVYIITAMSEVFFVSEVHASESGGLVFKTEEMAEEFIDAFIDLLQVARMFFHN